MQDYYLDSVDHSQRNHGYLLGTFASLYGWNLLGLGDQFLETGTWSLPGLSMIGAKRDMWNSGDLELRRTTSSIAKRTGASVGEKMGFKFRGATAEGMMNLGLARTLGAANLGAKLSSPGWYGASVLMSSAEAFSVGGMAAAGGVIGAGLAFGLPWFGGLAMLNNAAKNMKNGQYVNMGVPFVDNNSTYTSRQRGVRAIAESHLQARSAIGNEAMLFHHSGG